MENHVMQLLQEQRDYVLLSAAGLISTTQPGFPANSTRGVTTRWQTMLF
jgi:hypothetical protein